MVSTNTAHDNVLLELAQAMVSIESYPTAIALRKLAQAGYTTLEQVDSASDWVLLAIPGIGVYRLGAVRRLIRPEWEPPSSQAAKAADRFLSAARFALRFWPVETLESVIRGSTTSPANARPVEKRLAMELFTQAVCKASRHCEAEELVRALGQAYNGHAKSLRLTCDAYSGSDVHLGALNNNQIEVAAPDLPADLADESAAVHDNDRFAHPRHKRIEIVRCYWSARARGEVQNKDTWARAHYHICGKTLLDYEREFQDQRQTIMTATRGE
jgi:hypothetical protein